MPELSLQDGIDQAGSAVKLLWRAENVPHLVPVVRPEFTGWQEEASAWRDRAVLFDQSHHITNLFLDGPDALRLFADLCASDFERFEVGQAKQVFPVNSQGQMISDVILLRLGAQEFNMSGPPPAHTWVRYHAERGGYDVSVRYVPPSGVRPAGVPPAIYRYEIQGARAPEIMERLLGGPVPPVKFFHSAELPIAGRTVRALRHGMLGQAGFELLGPWEDQDAVVEAILAAGKPSGLVRAGGMAYYLSVIESGWIPVHHAAIYTDPGLEDYRRFVPLTSFEAQRPLFGSFYSENIEDYYLSPFELGFGRLMKFNHQFTGREALEKGKGNGGRAKVTLVFNNDDVRDVLGPDPGFVLRFGRYRVEAAGGSLAGQAMYGGLLPFHGTILMLALVDTRYAAPGTQVSVAWGEHPGPGAPLDAHRDFPRIRATVQAAPYDPFARTNYRR